MRHDGHLGRVWARFRDAVTSAVVLAVVAIMGLLCTIGFYIWPRTEPPCSNVSGSEPTVKLVPAAVADPAGTVASFGIRNPQIEDYRLKGCEDCRQSAMTRFLIRHSDFVARGTEFELRIANPTKDPVHVIQVKYTTSKFDVAGSTLITAEPGGSGLGPSVSFEAILSKPEAVVPLTIGSEDGTTFTTDKINYEVDACDVLTVSGSVRTETEPFEWALQVVLDSAGRSHRTRVNIEPPAPFNRVAPETLTAGLPSWELKWDTPGLLSHQ